MSLRLTTRAALLATGALAATATPAAATITSPGFTLAPASAQAGAHPDTTQDIQFASTDGDTPQSLALSLAPGLLANPTVAPPCKASDLQSASCPAASQVGSGSVTSTVTALGVAVKSDAKLYLVEPQPGELARVGLVVNTLLGNVVSSAPVTLRPADAGVDIAFTNLPRQVGNVAVTLNRVTLRLNGQVNGKSFTRNPTRCAPATTRFHAVSYAGSTADGSSVFTPTDCEKLAYAPVLSASAALDPNYDLGAALTSTVTQTADEAATRESTLTLPYGVLPRLTARDRACTAPDPRTCPASATIGSATLAIPLLAAPLNARVVMIANGGQLAGLSIVLPSPFALHIDGTTTLTGDGRLATKFTGIPDAPLTSLRLTIDGGPDSPILVTPLQCLNPGNAVGDFTAHSSRAVSVTAPLALSNCPAPA